MWDFREISLIQKSINYSEVQEIGNLLSCTFAAFFERQT